MFSSACWIILVWLSVLQAVYVASTEDTNTGAPESQSDGPQKDKYTDTVHHELHAIKKEPVYKVPGPEDAEYQELLRKMTHKYGNFTLPRVKAVKVFIFLFAFHIFILFLKLSSTTLLAFYMSTCI